MRLAIAAILLCAVPALGQGTAKRGVVQVKEAPVAKLQSDSGAGAMGAVHITVDNSENVTIHVEFHSDDDVGSDYSITRDGHRDGNRDVGSPELLQKLRSVGKAKGGPPPVGAVRAKQRHYTGIPCYDRSYPGGLLSVYRRP